MKKYAVIVAGGSGTRMGAAIPKQFLLLNGKPLISYTLEAFLQSFDDLQLILVLPKTFLEEARTILEKSSDAKRIRLCEGGATRFHSVKNGLELTEDPSVIFVHDGVRCLVSTRLIQNCYQQAFEKGSAIPAVAVTDSIRKINAEGTEAVDRNLLRAIQTPQTFRSEIILAAFNQPYSESFTDEATAAEAAGFSIHLIEGEKENIKITYQSDIQIAEIILDEKKAGANP